MSQAVGLALGSYWFAGVLTVLAAAIVTAVIVVTSRTDDDRF
jgi:hypothetical protein